MSALLATALPLWTEIKSFDFQLLIVMQLVIVLFAGSQISKKGEWQAEPFSLGTSKCIQGFAAVGIIIHHIAQTLGDNNIEIGVFSMFKDIGVMFVGVFFFFSGYGLFKSFKTKENYLKGFFKKRLPAVLVPFYVCILIFVGYALISGQKMTAGEIIASVTGWSLINSHMWYIVEIVLLYIVFFLSFRFIKNEKIALAVMSVFTAALTAGSLLLGHGEDYSCKYWFMGEWWYNTTLLFIVGMLIAKNENGFVRVIKKCYAVILPIFVVITYVLLNITKYVLDTYSYWAEWEGHMGYKEKFICLAAQLPMVIFFVLTLILIMMKIKFTNPVLSFLGSVSLELYLLHNIFLSNLPIDKLGGEVYALLTIICSLILALIVNRIDKLIISKINAKKALKPVNS